MIVDQELRVANATTVRASNPDFSTEIDLTVSPELAHGTEIYAVIVVDSYTANGSGSTTIDIVTDANADFSGTNRVIGSKTLTTAQLEARDDDANKQPIVIRIEPDQEDEGGLVSSVNERYLGIKFTHADATPSAFTVTAYFTTNYQSNPNHAYHASGSVIL